MPKKDAPWLFFNSSISACVMEREHLHHNKIAKLRLRSQKSLTEAFSNAVSMYLVNNFHSKIFSPEAVASVGSLLQAAHPSSSKILSGWY